MKNRRLPFYVCLLAGAACALFFAEVRSGSKWRDYKTLIGETLTEALRRELAVRDTGNIPVSAELDDLDENLPDTVKGYMETEQGRLYYAVPKGKYCHNIGDSRSVRVTHTYWMLDVPMAADSLYSRWRQILDGQQVSSSSVGLRLRLPGSRQVVCLPDSVSVAHADSICVRYAGLYCELEAVAFSSVGRCRLLGWTDWLLALLVGEICCLGCAGLCHWCRYRWSCRKTETDEACVPAPPVGAVADTESGKDCMVIRLGVGSVELESGLLCGPGGTEKLTDRKIRMLTCFLEAEGLRVEKAVLRQLFWPKISDKNASSNLRTTLTRLREKLKLLGVGIVSEENYYHLLLSDEIGK